MANYSVDSSGYFNLNNQQQQPGNNLSNMLASPNQIGLPAKPEKTWGQRIADWFKSVGSGIKDFTLGSPGGIQNVENFTPEQMQILDQLLGGGLNQFQNPYQGFEGLQEAATRHFKTELLPSIAERFAGTNSARSSAFENALSAGASNLESQLNAQKALFGQQQQKTGLQAIGLGLQPRFTQYQTPGSKGLLPGVIESIAPIGALAGLTKYSPAVSELVKNIYSNKS